MCVKVYMNVHVGGVGVSGGTGTPPLTVVEGHEVGADTGPAAAGQLTAVTVVTPLERGS